MKEERRLELIEDIYGVITGESIEFIHEDVTVYPHSTIVLLEDLVPGKLFDYELTAEDITWILSMRDSFKDLD